MRDVATYGSWRLPVYGAGFLALALCFLGAAVAVPFFIADQAASGRASWWLLLLGALPLLLGWTAFTHGVRRLRETFEDGCFLRAGPEGLSLRLPGDIRRRTAWLAYDYWEYRFRWEEVQSISWSIEGDASRSLLISARGGRLLVDGVYFKESLQAILERMREAALPARPPIQKTTL